MNKVSPKSVELENTALLKKELENLKTENNKKEESIKQLNNIIKVKEADLKNLDAALVESGEKFNEEISKITDDLEFYKKSYEEQKNRVNHEHQLITSNLYELALQFMGLKNELQKKISTNNNNTNNSFFNNTNNNCNANVNSNNNLNNNLNSKTSQTTKNETGNK